MNSSVRNSFEDTTALMEELQVKGARSSNKLHRLDFKLRSRDNRPDNGYQGDMPYS